MKSYTIYSAMLIATIAGSASADVIITGILDGPLPNGVPKAIELYVDGTVDFAGFDLLKSSNGGAFSSTADLSGLGVITDSFVYLVGTGSDGLANFDAVFGSSGDFANVYGFSGVTGNGDDGFQVADASDTVIDQVWQADTSDIYLDSYLYRVNGTGPEGATWNAASWLIPGNNILDGMDATQTAATVPFGTYQVPSPGAMALLTMGGLISTRRRRA